MGGFLDRLRGRRPAEASTAAPIAWGGECQFSRAWEFSVPAPVRAVVDVDGHEGPMRSVRLRPAGGGPPAPFTLCRAHATELVRYQMSTGRRIVAR